MQWPLTVAVCAIAGTVKRTQRIANNDKRIAFPFIQASRPAPPATEAEQTFRIRLALKLIPSGPRVRTAADRPLPPPETPAAAAHSCHKLRRRGPRGYSTTT